MLDLPLVGGLLPRHRRVVSYHEIDIIYMYKRERETQEREINILFSYPAPSQVGQVTLVVASSTTLTVTWDSPSSPNGLITGYEVIATPTSTVGPGLSPGEHCIHRTECS